MLLHNSDAQLRTIVENDWLSWCFYTFILIAALHLFIKWRYYNYLEQVTKSLRSSSSAALLYENHRNKDARPFALLALLSIAVLATLSSSLLMKYSIFKGHWLQVFSWSILTIGAFVFIRALALKFLGVIFPIGKSSDYWHFTLSLVAFSFVHYCWPLLIAFVLIEDIPATFFSISALCIGASFLGLSIYRAYFIGSSYIIGQGFSFFLYLCTFEILPLALYSKFIANWSQRVIFFY